MDLYQPPKSDAIQPEGPLGPPRVSWRWVYGLGICYVASIAVFGLSWYAIQSKQASWFCLAVMGFYGGIPFVPFFAFMFPVAVFYNLRGRGREDLALVALVGGVLTGGLLALPLAFLIRPSTEPGRGMAAPPAPLSDPDASGRPPRET